MMIAGELEGQQMRHLAAFGAAFAMVSWGGGAQDASQPPRAKPAAFARIVEREHAVRKPIPELDMPKMPAEEPAPKDPAEIKLSYSVVALREPELAELGIAWERAVTIASAEHRQKLIERARAIPNPPPLLPCRLAKWHGMPGVGEPMGAILHSHHFSFPSSRSVFLHFGASYNYIAGVRLEDFEPIIGNVPAGLIVGARALPLGTETLFTLLSVRVNALHSFQMVELEAVEVGAKAGKVKMKPGAQEPCFLLRKSAVPSPCSLRVKAGESLVVPLSDVAFLVAKSNFRAYVREGKARIQRDDTQKLLSRADARGYPLDEDVKVLVVLTPTVVWLRDHTF